VITALHDHERRHGSEHKIADRNDVLGDEQVCRQHDEIEADEEKNRQQ
jgi:hypothetical protein